MNKKLESKELERVLSSFAMSVFNQTNPVDIFESENGTYNIRVIDTRDDLTAEELNDYFLDLGEDVILSGLYDALVEKADDYQVDLWNEYISEWDGGEHRYVREWKALNDTIDWLRARGVCTISMGSRQYDHDTYFTVEVDDNNIARINTFTWPVEKGPIDLNELARFAYEQDWAFNDPDIDAVLHQFDS